MSAINSKGINKVENSSDGAECLKAALARYTRHIAEQEHQLDLLALYTSLEHDDPLRSQLNRVQLQGVLISPNMHALADIALAYEMLCRMKSQY